MKESSNLVEPPTALMEAMAHVSERPEDPHAWVALGKQLKQAGKLDEARDSFERALFLDPSLELVYDELIALKAREALPAWFQRLKSQAGGSDAASHRWPSRAASILLLFLALFVAVNLTLTLTMDGPQKAPAARGSFFPSRAMPFLVDPDLGRDVGRTRDYAAPVGYPVLTDEGMRYTIKDINPDAWAIVQASDPDHDPPPTDMAMYLVRLQVENVSGEESESLLFAGSDFEMLGESGASYDERCGLIPEELGRLGTSVGHGQATEGNICLLVPQDEKIVFLLYEPLIGSDRRYFSVEASPVP